MDHDLHILHTSPLDCPTRQIPELVQIEVEPSQSWVPSRFNARAVAPDGRIIIWNSYSGSINIFESKHRGLIERLLSRRGFRGELNGFAKYLFDRGFLVSSDADEFRRAQLQAGKQHYDGRVLELILLPSEDCNFRCKYCYEEFARGTMTVETRQRVRRLVEKTIGAIHSFHVSWFGGEPLYGMSAIEDLAPYFVQLCSERQVNYSSNMTTNGYLLTPNVVDKLLLWKIMDFQITIDGPREQHNANRPARDGGETFDVIFQNLVALHQRDADFSVTLRLNFDPQNSPHMQRLIEHIHTQLENDPRFTLAFHPVGKWGGPNDDSYSVCDSREQAEITERLRHTSLTCGLKVNGLRSSSYAGQNVCYAARPFSFIIGADGKVMKCTVALDKDPNNVVGELAADGEINLNLDRLALWTEPAFEQDSGCRACQMLPSCQGMYCPLIRIQNHQAPCPDIKKTMRVELLRTLAEMSNVPGPSATG